MDHPATRLRRLLGLELPLLQGGMTFGSDARLVAAVSNAGALGTLGTFHYREPGEVEAQVAAIRAATTRPFAVNVPFFQRSEELVERLAREHGVRLFTLGGWLTPRIAALREELELRLLVSVNAPTVARMVLEHPLDVLIVQGNESGGANGPFTTRQLFDLLQPTCPATPVVLAGGQWDGADLHRALLLGAAGIQLGTRFFLSADSPLHASIKRQLLEHNLKRPLTTALTPVSDTLQMRFVANKPYRTALDSGELVATFQDKERVFDLSAAFFRPQERPLLVYAGAGVYKLRAIQTAGEIVREVAQEYELLRATALPAL